MSKLLLLSHADLSKEFYNAIHLIMGKPDDRVDFLTLPYGTDIEKYQRQLEERVVKAGDEGILILTDLFGGSPFMISTRVYQKYHERVQIEIVTGANLPMIAELMTNLDKDVKELKKIALEAGLNGIVDFSSNWIRGE